MSFRRFARSTRRTCPTQPSALVGRERELAELPPLVRAERLVTLTGPGGSGKTRLALQVAAELVGEFADGVFWVPLASVTDPGSSSRRSLRRSGRATTWPARRDGRSCCSCSTISSSSSTPRRRSATSSRLPAVCEVLVTSRSRRCASRASSEYRSSRFRRATRSSSSSSGPARSGRSSRRTKRCRGDLPPPRRPAAGGRARRRAHRSSLAAEPLLERLDQRLPLLTGGARDAPERQRTLRATIEWSYDLLDAARQGALRAARGLRRAASRSRLPRQVCDADLDALGALVDSSLVKPIGDDRFLMLETIREYALERLEGSARQKRSGSGTPTSSSRSPSRRTCGGSTLRRSGRHDSSSTTTTFAPRSTGWRRTMLTARSSSPVPSAGSGSRTGCSQRVVDVWLVLSPTRRQPEDLRPAP